MRWNFARNLVFFTNVKFAKEWITTYRKKLEFPFLLCRKRFSKIFLLGEISHKIWDNPHGHQYWWPSTPSLPNTNQKAHRQAVQLPLHRKNHHTPNLHIVAASLCTVVLPPPPSVLTGHSSSPQQTEYSQIWLSMFWALVQNPHKQKKTYTKILTVFFFDNQHKHNNIDWPSTMHKKFNTAGSPYAWNTNWRERFSTVDLLSKLGRFA
jgi:hypothetical protein